MGASLSVFDFASVGASLSLRSFSRFGSTMSICSTLIMGSGDIHFTTINKGIYGRNSDDSYTRRVSFPDGDGAGYEGILHGQWFADVAPSSSDRRLKTNIAPLQQTLLSHMSRAKAKDIEATDTSGVDASASADVGGRAAGGTETKNDRQEVVDWVLRELRPVSFSFRQGLDSKSMKQQGHQRFGFIAQEVERVAPNLVREAGGTKAMVYQDLIAMITLAAQDHHERLDQHYGEVGKLRGLLKRLGEKLGHLTTRVARVIGPFELGPKTGPGRASSMQHRSK